MSTSAGMSDPLHAGARPGRGPTRRRGARGLRGRLARLGAKTAAVAALAALSGLGTVPLAPAAASTTQAQPPAPAPAAPAAPAGLPAGTRLEVTEANPMRITEDGAVVEGLDLRGSIWISADNVTVRNSRVSFGGYHAIRVFPEADGTVVENVEIDCTNSGRTKGIVFGNYTARAVVVNGCRRPFVGGSDVTVEASVIDGRPYDTASGEPLPGRSWWCVGAMTPLCGGAVGESWAPPPTTAPPTTAPTTTTTAPPAPTPPAPEEAAGPPPSTDGFPSAATTGFNNCGRSVGQLEARSGSVTLNDGDVLENFDLSGSIQVNGTDVTIRCGRVRSGAMYGITAASGGSYVVEDVQIVGTASDPSRNSAGISPLGNWTARNVEVTRFRDGIKLGSNQTVENSWIHDLWVVPGSHNDGMQSVGGTNVTVRGNNIEANWRGQTSAMIILSDNSRVTNYTITGNRLSGGGFTVYIGAKPDAQTPQNVTLTDNVFVSGSATYGPLNVRANWPAADGGSDVGNNIFTAGGAVGVPSDCSSCP